jgi:transcriptional regulator with XRE-family HTH domain
MQQSSEKQRRNELGKFLRTRRARLSSTQVGMPEAPRKRTPGLRREEVAIAAGVSTTWYTYLEQGRDIQASGSILSSLANVLQLTDDERTHLFTLANQPLPTKIPSLEKPVQRTYQRVLDELGTLPAILTGRTYDVLGYNRAAKLVFGDFDTIPESERNILWLLFARTPWSEQITLFVEREEYAQEVLETFRSRITGYWADATVQAFIERLQQASPLFREQWAKHNVRSSCATSKQLQHPLVGTLTFEYAKFQLIEHPAIRCHMYIPGNEESTCKLHQLLQKNSDIDILNTIK